MPALVRSTDRGLFCEEGGFYIDPWSPAERAVLTHAHSDHACPGSEQYLVASALPVFKARLGEAAPITVAGYGTALQVGGVRVSFHPAGHLLGSAQVRVERVSPTESGPAGEVWVVSGDYKTVPDATCPAFELVRAHTFITESTFGLPVYRWPHQDQVLASVNQWWRANQAAGRTSVIFAYPLGKAQRILAGLDPSIGPIGAHGAIARMNDAYAECGVRLPSATSATGDAAKPLRGTGLVLAPPSTTATTWLRRLAGPEGIATGFVSGWMMVRGARRRRNVDRGFVLSDHADWPALVDTVRATGAEHVGVTHGYAHVLARYLKELGQVDAFVVPSRFTGEIGESLVGEAAAKSSDPQALLTGPDEDVGPPGSPP